VALQREILPDADAGDESIPGGRVSTEKAFVIADRAAAAETQEDT
jgi:hypothetical protein